MRLLAVFLAFSLAVPAASPAGQVGETPVPPASPRASSHNTSSLPRLAPMMLALPLLMSAPQLNDRLAARPAPITTEARNFLLPPTAVPTGPPGGPPDGSPGAPASLLISERGGASFSDQYLSERAVGWNPAGFAGPRAPADRSAWFDQSRVAERPADSRPGAMVPPPVPAEAVLYGNFRNDLKELEPLLPAELLERTGALRHELDEAARQRGLARFRAAEAVKDVKDSAEKARRIKEAVASDPDNIAGERRTVLAGTELLRQYDAVLPPAEKLDFSSPGALRASIAWSRKLHASGASSAYRFRTGPYARRAALAVRSALLEELPKMATPEFEAVARAISTPIARDGTTYVAFSGAPETLRVVLGGYERALQDRLNRNGGRFRVLPADTPVPEGMEASGTGTAPGEDNPFCAEKKLFSVLRGGAVGEVSEWAVLWRGDPHHNTHGVQGLREFMQPCAHCIRNADKILARAALAAR